MASVSTCSPADAIGPTGCATFARNRRSGWRLGGTTLTGRARIIEGEPPERRARQLLAGKYQRWREGQPLSGWARSALPVEIELG